MSFRCPILAVDIIFQNSLSFISLIINKFEKEDSPHLKLTVDIQDWFEASEHIEKLLKSKRIVNQCLTLQPNKYICSGSVISSELVDPEYEVDDGFVFRGQMSPSL